MDPIQIDPEIMGGTPCFAGTRVPVKTLFDYLAHGHPLDEFMVDFPTVRREQAIRAIDLAGKSLLASVTATSPTQAAVVAGSSR